MKKFIMILGILAMGGAIVLGLQNKGTLESTKSELDSVKVEVKKVTTELGATEDKRDASIVKETQAKDKRNQASAAIEGVKQNLKIITKSVDDASSDLKKAEIEKKEVDLLIKKTWPSGEITTIDDMQAKLTALKDNLTGKQSKVAELEAAYAQAKQVRKVEEDKVKKEEQYQIKRSQKLALNGMVATVIAVNKDWGFVMVNAGRAHGVSGDSSLLVRRGNSRVARLRIVNLQDMVSVCDIVKDSMLKGIKVQPGDKVIFENSTAK